jgi:large subunit ribosomal protein L4
MGLAAPSTKKAASMLSALDVRGSCLIVVAERDETAWKSVRNIEGASMLTADDVNAYELLRNRTVIFADGALERLAERVGLAETEESAR